MDRSATPPHQQPVTLNDIARISGVSRAAASRALNDRDGVRPEVRERVHHVADSLGYRPNAAARNLARGSAGVIGFLLPSDMPGVNRYGAALVQAVGNAARRHEQGLMLHLDRDEPGRDATRFVRSGAIDGVLVSSFAIGSPWAEELFKISPASVLIGGNSARPDLHTVEVENAAATAALVVHLYEQGRRRIAFIGGKRTRFDAQLRLDGYRAGLRQVGLAVDEQLIVEGDYSRATAFAAMPQLLANDPDAIVGANDESAVAAIRAIERHGLTVPHDIAVVGFDGTVQPELLDYALTTARQPFDRLAEVAVTSLLTLIGGGEVPRTQFVEPDLSFGNTSIGRRTSGRPGSTLGG